MVDSQNLSLKESLSLIKLNGKSFHWASLFLTKNTTEEAIILYSFCRLLDDLADQKGDKLLELQNYQSSISNIPIKVAGNTLMSFLKKHNINQLVIKDLIDGFIFDQGQVRIVNKKQLIIYCYQVAGTVGLMMNSILKPTSMYANKFAIDLGIAMQLTNIARDVKEDALDHNRQYLPSEMFDGVKFEKLHSISNGKKDEKENIKIKNAIAEILKISDEYYKSGMNGLRYLPMRSHISLGIAALVYRQIGVKLIKNNILWHKDRVYLSSLEKFFTSIKIIPHLFKRFLQNPIHNDDLHEDLKEVVNANYF
ncbi:phytoene/squalene synthase family protein [Alphaproteobacteria bacterium]|nr:phytoene/squalene synthase family protein [Alphaproteobacteria bacterium]